MYGWRKTGALISLTLFLLLGRCGRIGRGAEFADFGRPTSLFRGHGRRRQFVWRLSQAGRLLGAPCKVALSMSPVVDVRRGKKTISAIRDSATGKGTPGGRRRGREARVRVCFIPTHTGHGAGVFPRRHARPTSGVNAGSSEYRLAFLAAGLMTEVHLGRKERDCGKTEGR